MALRPAASFSSVAPVDEITVRGRRSSEKEKLLLGSEGSTRVSGARARLRLFGVGWTVDR